MDSQESGQTGSAQPPASTSCTNQTCMFFGSANTEGYCSVCYKAELGKREKAARDAVAAGQNNNNNNNSSSTAEAKKSEESNNTDRGVTISSGSNTTQTQSVPIAVMAQKIQQQTASAISSSAPVPVVPTSSSSLITTTPSGSSKRRNDDSMCSLGTMEMPMPCGTPDSKKSTPATPSKPKKRKCGVCKKKIGLTGFECRCGGLYCPLHRYADQHNCQHDYTTEGRNQLRKDNPVVQDDKIAKI